MAGVLAAPRGTDGNMVGVALQYKFDLFVVRPKMFFLIQPARCVVSAMHFCKPQNRADVRIISMSIGQNTNSSQ
jgi:hypothetical protein